MKVYNKIVYDIDTWEVLEEDSYEYEGPVASCHPVVVQIVIMVLLYVIQRMMMKKPPSMDDNETESGVKTNTRSTQEPLRIVYGTQQVGGNDVYGTTLGSHNKELYLVQSLSEGVCDSIYQDGGVDQIFIDDKIYTDFGATVSYTFHDGAANQTVDSTLNTAVPEHTDPYRNTCYIMFKFTWDENKYRGIPKRQLILKGRELYDFRDTTTAWSDNPVLCLYDFITNERYGLGIDSAKLDVTTFTTAANYCDTKGWGCNMVISRAGRDAWSVVEDILLLFRGTLTWFDGNYFLYFSDLNEESSVMTIEDKHIMQDASGKAAIAITQPSRFDKPEGIRVTFIDKDKQYTSDDIVIGDSVGLVEEYKLVGCTQREMASNLATSALERLKLNRIISGTFRDDCLLLGPHDIVTFNSTALGISDQLMRVVKSTTTDVGLINLSLEYESAELYDDDYDVDIEGTYTVDLPDPSQPSEISSTSVDEETYWYRMRSFTKLNVSFSVSEDEVWFKHVEAWISTTTDETSAYSMMGKYTSSFSIDPVEEGITYWIKLVTVNIWGTKSNFATADKVSKGVQGASTEIPESLASLSAIPGDNSVRLSADKLTDPDIEIYEFRLGEQWTGGVFLTAKRSPHEDISGIKPGTHTFTCNTRSTNGNYGDTPVDATITIEEPKGWTAYTTFTDDYTSDPGTFNNTEHVTYSADDYLKCSHTTITSGSYYSISFDTGIAADTYYVYLEASTVVTGLGTTWSAVLSGGTWDDINITTRTWREIFGIEEAPQVTMIIDWKAEVGHDWSQINHAEILAGVVTARYFRVRIFIEDPSEEVNALVENFTLNLLN